MKIGIHYNDRNNPIWRGFRYVVDPSTDGSPLVGYGNRRDGRIISTRRLDSAEREGDRVVAYGYESGLLGPDENFIGTICAYLTEADARAGHHALLEVETVDLDPYYR